MTDGPIATADSEFLNRELSWLEFNQRVLHEALDPRTPLLERVNFLSIFRSNLDEFFMKRVGGLKRQVAAKVGTKAGNDIPPETQLVLIRNKIKSLLDLQTDGIMQQIRPALFEEGVHLLRWDDLTPEERTRADKFFEEKVFPVLTPLAVDPGHPFPFLSNLSTSLGVLLKHPFRDEDHLFARVKIPDVFTPWIRVDGGENDKLCRFFSLPEMIARNLHQLFPGMDVLDLMVFRIIRNADIERDEEDVEDLIEMIEEELRERRFAKVVRLEHGPNPNPKILSLLTEELELSSEDVYELPLELDYFSLKSVYEVNRPDLKYQPWQPVTPLVLADEETNFLDLIRENDYLVHHPYESFSATVERFIRNAVDDPNVVAIKMTLYRTGDDSPFIPLLIEAAEMGKQVACLVELKARFDEQKNILAAQKLEKAGVHVVYGIVGLKTHCKVALVVRSERDSLRSYCHIGTGNYHASTARVYTDLGLFSADPELSADVVHLFHYLTGRSLFFNYKKLVIAPVALRLKFMELIEREMTNAQKGLPARIIAKMNSLEDKEISRALYAASQAGVKIDLIVRGVCCLRPGVADVSENIRVISVIGRFLEHSRIFYFADGAKAPLDGSIYIGSADWMYRNLSSRVEAVVPIENKILAEKCWNILETMLADRRQAWEMKSDGSYVQLVDGELAPGEAPSVGTHKKLMDQTMWRESVS
ncbi:MAG: polyphosphate kinase 1 [Oligoflexia bacterium]|nr:polyphosphate kinase 1 [Oligoflexia bacterium]